MKPAPLASEIFSAPGPRLYTINPERPFLADMAQILYEFTNASERFELADIEIFLPTRRAIRSLEEVFVNANPSRASLLPRMRALGDLDEDEIIAVDADLADELALPPPISSLERRFVLAKLVAAKDRSFAGQERWASALAAGDALAQLLDSFYTEELSPKSLREIAPEHLAIHWQKSLSFLTIIFEAWPAFLEERGLTDPADRRVKQIEARRRNWERNPPSSPVIIAGTTGSTPAVSRLIKTISGIPNCCALLPGLDLRLEENIWAQIDEPHPQYGLKQLLTAIEATRADVAPWPNSEPTSQQPGRHDLFSVALHPAAASGSWRRWAQKLVKNKAFAQSALDQMEFVEAEDEEREAEAIAIKIRGAVEEADKSVALVTPDRSLARRVCSKLIRFNINVDDSAGVPFANTPCGVFLRLVSIWMAKMNDSAALFAIIRHPLFNGRLDASKKPCAVDALDHALRGLPPSPSASGFRKKVLQSDVADEAAPLVDLIEEAMAIVDNAGADFQSLLSSHLEVAALFAATKDITGEEMLWRGEDGAAGASTLGELQSSPLPIDKITHTEYPDIFNHFIANIAVRNRAPTHPRISILGPLEARLMQADLTILGGLNEGVWPRDAAIDPFLSRPMRKNIGLPSPERRIGLAAHDFSQLTAGGEIMLTRSARSGGKPTNPSRWLVRLKNILSGAGLTEKIDRTAYYSRLAESIDTPEKILQCTAPMPTPPLAARPKKVFVTHIETLLRDPYAIYAKQILKLRTLDPHNEQFGPRHAGSLFHAILERFLKDGSAPTIGENVSKLRALFDELAPQFGMTNAEVPFWSASTDSFFKWFGKEITEITTTPVVLEQKGAVVFDIDSVEISLHARADRIDENAAGDLTVLDYKTGTPPTLRQHKDFSPQLPLTGYIAAQGGFAETDGARNVSELRYVRLLGRSPGGKSDTVATGNKAKELIAEAEQKFTALMRHYLDPNSPYLSQPRPQYANNFGDYDHLARRRERNARGTSS